MNGAGTGAFTVVGAGLAGSLMGILLARRRHPVLLLERRSDPRGGTRTEGRSINLALADRGLAALSAAGVHEAVEPLLVPMRGRLVHESDGSTRFIPYGQQEREAIYSVSRAALNRVLLDEFARLPGTVIGFEQECTGADFDAGWLRLRDTPSGRSYRVPLDRVIAADGAHSPCRRSLVERFGVAVTEEPLAHGYKELTVPADAQGQPQLDPHALHIWPRGGFMLIALPNTDGSFTATLFLPLAGTPGFASLATGAQVIAFFERHFADVLELMPDLAREFADHPTGRMATIRCEQWSGDGRLLLIGDAAHAIVPFHGQGMNCAFEDCRLLAEWLADGAWTDACNGFTAARRADTDAIARMAIENYLEMRDTVREPAFQLQKDLSLELERRFPRHFIPRYSMVMFHHEIPYRVALERGSVQAGILDELTLGASDLSGIDFERAGALIAERLPPLPDRS